MTELSEQRIHSLGKDKLSDYDLRDVANRLPDVEWFIYDYEALPYEGEGYAIWQIGDKFGYGYLGHCSCYGPCEDLNTALFTLDELRKIDALPDKLLDLATTLGGK